MTKKQELGGTRQSESSLKKKSILKLKKEEISIQKNLICKRSNSINTSSNSNDDTTLASKVIVKKIRSNGLVPESSKNADLEPVMSSNADYSQSFSFKRNQRFFSVSNKKILAQECSASRNGGDISPLR